MASPIAGTVSWAADVSQSSSYVGGSGGDPTFFPGRFTADPAGQYVYIPCRNGTGKVLRLHLTGANAGKLDILYAGNGLAATSHIACHVSEDNATLYVIRLTGGVANVYAVPADGSGGTPFALTDSYSSGTPATQFKVFKEPGVNRLFQTNGGDRPMAYTVPGTWGDAAHFPATLSGDIFLDCTGFDQSGRYVFAGSSSGFGGVYCMPRQAERWMRLVGTGGGVTAVNVDPWQVGTGRVHDAWACDEFEVSARGVVQAGWLYYSDEAKNVRRLGTDGVVHLLTNGVGVQVGMVYEPVSNSLLAGDGYTIRKLV